MQLTDFILTPHLTDTDDCQSFIDFFESHPESWIQNYTLTEGASGNSNDWKVASQIYTNDYPEWENKIFHLVGKAFEYINRLPVSPPYEIYSENYNVRKYPANEGRFKVHIDAQRPHLNRVYAFILYLNTLKEGGETRFPDLGLSVKPEAGKSLLFPCNWMYSHEVLPSPEDRYVLTAFLCTPL